MGRPGSCERCLAEIESRLIEPSFDDVDWLVDQVDDYEDLGGNPDAVCGAKQFTQLVAASRSAATRRESPKPSWR